MEHLNIEIITKLLSTHEKKISKIRIHNWEVDNTIIEAGNNFGSEITRLTIHYEKDGEQCSQNYIYKLHYKTSSYEKSVKMGIHKKEPDMYTLVLPEMPKLDKNLAPLCFHFDDKGTLILEDLSLSGYKPTIRREQLDFEHCRLVFTNLAKFHGFSVYLDKFGKLPDSVKEGDVFKKMFDGSEYPDWNSMRKPYLEMLEEPLKNRYLAKFAQKDPTINEEIFEIMRPTKNGFNCLNHGDFWITNMMFKYDEYGLVESMKFIDFQMVHWTSPVLDILQFTITSMRFEVYEKYFDFLLDIYLETLNKILMHFHYDTYKKEDFRKDIKDRFTYFILTAIGMIPFVLRDSKNDDLKDTGIEKTLEDGEGSKVETQAFDGNSYATKVIIKWLKSFAERGQLDEWC